PKKVYTNIGLITYNFSERSDNEKILFYTFSQHSINNRFSPKYYLKCYTLISKLQLLMLLLIFLHWLLVITLGHIRLLLLSRLLQAPLLIYLKLTTITSTYPL